MSTAAPTTAPRPRLGFRGVVLVLSLLLNLGLLAVLAVALLAPADAEPAAVVEQHYAGDRTAPDKVAVVKVTGVLVEGMTGWVRRQVDHAAKDRAVKAVVVRVDSPGGTISASEEVHKALTDLRDNTHGRFAGTGPKPLVASMGSVAASGGYYVAMPAKTVVAERTTITGSIGVFVALPNVAELANKNGVRVELIKAGHIKAGGSPLQSLVPAERQPWQDVVDHAYDRFLTVVADGRPGLSKDRLVNEQAERTVPEYDDKGDPKPGPGVKTHRYRADGGTYTPPQALALGLIDGIADVPAAAKLAADAAGLSRYRVVAYERPKGLAEVLLGVELRQPHGPAEAVGAALSPKVWYLAPGYELSGALTANLTQ